MRINLNPRKGRERDDVAVAFVRFESCARNAPLLSVFALPTVSGRRNGHALLRTHRTPRRIELFSGVRPRYPL